MATVFYEPAKAGCMSLLAVDKSPCLSRFAHRLFFLHVMSTVASGHKRHATVDSSLYCSKVRCIVSEVRLEFPCPVSYAGKWPSTLCLCSVSKEKINSKKVVVQDCRRLPNPFGDQCLAVNE